MWTPSALPRTWEAVVRDASNESTKVRISALRDGYNYAEERRADVIELYLKLLDDVDAQVRSESAVFLGEMKANEGLARLLVRLEDDNDLVRQMAVVALGEIGDIRSAERLRRALQDERPEVRFQAVIAFPKVCLEEGLSALQDALRDKDPLIRHIGLRVLEEQLDHHSAVPMTAGTAKRFSLPPEVEQLAKDCLQDEHQGVRVAAALLLAGGGSSAGAGVLLAVVAGEVKAQEPDDEAAAVEAVGQLRLKKAIPFLESRAFGPSKWFRERFSFLAQVSLAQLGHTKATEGFLRDLHSWSTDRQTLAVIAVGRARLVQALPRVRLLEEKARRIPPEVLSETLAMLESEC
jgi:HEAT repeat protein